LKNSSSKNKPSNCYSYDVKCGHRFFPQKFMCPSAFIVLYFFIGPCDFHSFASMLILGGKRNQRKRKRREKGLDF
jgi:hypothetical protein